MKLVIEIDCTQYKTLSQLPKDAAEVARVLEGALQRSRLSPEELSKKLFKGEKSEAVFLEATGEKDDATRVRVAFVAAPLATATQISDPLQLNLNGKPDNETGD